VKTSVIAISILLWRLFPSSEEGRPRRFNIGTLPQEIGAAGEVRRRLRMV